MAELFQAAGIRVFLSKNNRREGETMVKIITAKEAAEKINDYDTVAVTSVNLGSFPEELVAAIKERFLESQKPEQLTLLASTGMGDSTPGRGMDHFAQEGLVKRVITAFCAQSPMISDWMAKGKVEGYLLPQGEILQLYRAAANHYPGVFSKIGLHTFVDPRLQGGKVNANTTEDLVGLMEIEGEEYLHYKPIPVSVGLIRGTYADTNGNIVVTQESNIMELFSVSAAAHNSGGIVMAQVKKVVEAGSLDPKSIIVPGALLDYIIVNENPEYHKQTSSTQYDPGISGEFKTVQDHQKNMPLTVRKIIARRAAQLLDPGSTVNLGVGMADGVAHIVYEEGCSDEITLTIDTGIFGGKSALGPDFGTAYNPEAIISHENMFDYYNGGGLDTAFLGLAQVDKQGNVNVSKFGPKVTGPGGFINITQTTPKLVFMGTMVVGAEYAIEDNRLKILKEGRSNKFVDQVEQITFSGKYGSTSGQEIYFVTERGVFDIDAGKLRLIEIAPGLEVGKDIQQHIAFELVVSPQLKEMDSALFQERWGKLKEILEAKRTLKLQ